MKKCPHCYGTGDATAYVAAHGGRLVIQVVSGYYSPCQECDGTGHLTADIRRCRVCDCTDDDCSGCVERTGEPCYWVSDAIDICSACFYFDTSPDERPALPYGTPVA